MLGANDIATQTAASLELNEISTVLIELRSGLSLIAVSLKGHMSSRGVYNLARWSFLTNNTSDFNDA